jgi:hypothetical protein
MKIVVNPQGELEERTKVVKSFYTVLQGASVQLEFLWIKTEQIRESFAEVFPDIKDVEVSEKRYISKLNAIARKLRETQLAEYQSSFEIKIGNLEIEAIQKLDRGFLLSISGFKTVYVETSKSL